MRQMVIDTATKARNPTHFSCALRSARDPAWLLNPELTLSVLSTTCLPKSVKSTDSCRAFFYSNHAFVLIWWWNADPKRGITCFSVMDGTCCFAPRIGLKVGIICTCWSVQGVADKYIKNETVNFSCMLI